jgi:two-component system response regulator HydG
MTKKIVIVDDEITNLTPLKKILNKEGYEVTPFTDPLEALEHIRSNHPHIVISDLRMPGIDGLSLLKSTKIISPLTKFILITAYGTVENAVTAMKDEATDFISKPIKRDRLLETVQKALFEQEMLEENIEQHQNIQDNLIGSSKAFSKLMDMIKRAAKSNATILIEGETGTGKTVIAREIHKLSTKRSFNFYTLDCNAIPDTLIESELFGHEKGAFTGAEKQKIGRFEIANNGTILLDEIGEIPPHVQLKLLRILQDGEFERLGGTQTIKTDVRIIAATNKDLEQEIKEKRFREDLYYRLNVINLKTPPLRDRIEDIEPLAKAFLKKFSEKQDKTTEFAPLVIKYLKKYSWPGNIRELEHAIESAVAMSIESSISLDSMPVKITDQVENILSQNEKSFQKRLEKNKVVSFPIGTTIKEIQAKMINEALEFTENDINLSANLLGINSRTIYRHLEK